VVLRSNNESGLVVFASKKRSFLKYFLRGLFGLCSCSRWIKPVLQCPHLTTSCVNARGSEQSKGESVQTGLLATSMWPNHALAREEDQRTREFSAALSTDENWPVKCAVVFVRDAIAGRSLTRNLGHRTWKLYNIYHSSAYRIWYITATQTSLPANTSCFIGTVLMLLFSWFWHNTSSHLHSSTFQIKYQSYARGIRRLS
jgi:hypothetical protein